MKTVAAQIWAELPNLERGWSTRLVPFAREIVGDQVRTGLYVLVAAVAVLLLIACANLSNLMLVRASARAHELAVRAALGAGRWQIARQLVGEALVLATIGGLLGVLLALWAVDSFHTLPLPRAQEITIDLRVLGVALGTTFLTALLSTAVPALRAAQTRPNEVLKNYLSQIAPRSRLRDAGVVIQIALSLTMLVGAALVARSFLKLLHVDPGFSAHNVLTLSLRPATDHTRAVAFYDELVKRVSALPGVTASGLISILPFDQGNTSLNVFPLGPAALAPEASVQADWRLAHGDYFRTLRIPVLQGKTFANLPADEARRSVVISASLARA
ncbi:MAG TPA: FtsX-like permease family protein, partial [Opitutus sp.]|nr:FtsX-like permease family protein [Opitutus sp.]